MPYNYLDLFSGIGGWHYGAKLAGWKFENTFNSDIDEYANAIYKQHFPESVNLGSITSIDGYKLRAEHDGDWIVSGSFPCQDLSGHTRGAGLDGARSGLWFEMLRVCRELQPKYILAENVAALRWKGLNRVLHGLAECGYDGEWQTIPGTFVGSPQLRKRIWLVSYPNVSNTTGGVFSMLAEKSNMGDGNKYSKSISGTALWFDWKNEVYARRAHGLPTVHRKTYGVSGRLDEYTKEINDRGKCLGNAIIPQLAEVLWRGIAAREERLAMMGV